jgi:hypothetical protein
MAQVFVSPGVYTQEIDQTFRPNVGGGGVGGAAIIGLSEKGPAFVPVSFTNVNTFANRFGVKTDGAEGYTYQAVNAYMNEGNRTTFVRVLGKDSATMGKAGLLAFPTTGSSTALDDADNVILGIVRQRTGTDTISIKGKPSKFDLIVGSATASDLSMDPTADGFIINRLGTDAVNADSSSPLPDVFVDTVYGYGVSSVTGETANGSSAVDVSVDFDSIGGGFSEAGTPWVVSQNLGNSVSNLFRFHSIGSGDAENKSMYVQISNVEENEADEWPTFDVTVVGITANQGANPGFTDAGWSKSFGSVSLDPEASNYIAKVVGDAYPVYDFSETPPLVTYNGEYQVTNNYVRVEVASNITPSHKPSGARGISSIEYNIGNSVAIAPLSYKLNHIDDSSGLSGLIGVDYSDSGMVDRLKKTSTTVGSSTATDALVTEKGYLTVSGTGEGGVLSLTDVALGTTFSASADPIVIDLGADYDLSADDKVTIAGTGADIDKVHTVVSVTGSSFTSDQTASADPSSVTATTVTIEYSSKTNNITEFEVIDTTQNTNQFNQNDLIRFNVPFTGGFDGFDYRTDKVKALNATTDSLSASYIDAINILSNPDIYDFDILATPGVHSANVGEIPQLAINMVKGRGDAFYLLDIGTDASDMDANGRMSITSALSEVAKYDSSYAATYYPWIRFQGKVIPPSIQMLGVYAFNDRAGGPWYAPAGFRRGSLRGGITPTRPLTQSQRDELYKENINPISSFTNQGSAVFGQKTLQSKASVLDRVNVRRMLLKVRKDISRIARTFLFEQNSATVREQLLNRVNNVLSGVQSANGLTEFRAILDETTTTPDLIDRNIMMGKIFLKPTSAAEVIVFDFTVSPQGASFDEV